MHPKSDLKKADEFDVELLGLVKILQASSSKPAHRPQEDDTSTEVTFGLLLATTLKRLDGRTKALAQLKIQEVVFAAKFADPEQYFSWLYGVLVS